MTTLTKIIVSTMLALVTFSCQFDFNMGVKGNGNIVTESRTVNYAFSEIHAARGLEVILTKGNEESITVEADENLQDIITTEVKNNILKITTEDNINWAASKKVYVTYTALTKIKATSGSEVHAKGTLNASQFEIDTSSGSYLQLQLNADKVICESSSGSTVNLSGHANTLQAQSSSGSTVKATDFKTNVATVRASSGGNIDVFAINELHAKASSGGSISYIGNPEIINSNDGASGSISKI
ncbi:MAG TPA: head GIN domain-containing protein [Flavobacteriaceae bacterium]|nr:head GIN domain-containing protein [Flavobacteriaceae bacterium]